MNRVVLLILVAAASPAAAETPNLLVITLDTTRADHLGCYGARSAKTPVLDGLAARGALMEQAHSHVPLTLPSHASLLSGQLPSALDLHLNGMHLKDGVETLATRLQARGYWTGAVVASVVLHHEYGLARGFTVYDDKMNLAPRGGGDPEERRADDVTEAALAATSRVKGPFFLWVHYYDPHFEYRPPDPYARQRNLYDGEIAYMDAALGKLLDGLQRRHQLDDTLIVVAGDHGEGLMERGEKQHGAFLYEYALHVPLLFVWPGHIRPSKIPNLCGLTDVAPTVLELLDQGPLTHSDGQSLKPLLDGGALAPRNLYAETYHGFFSYGWAPLRAILTDRWKFIDAPRPELYEWHSSEDKNFYAEGRAETRAARKALSRHPLAGAADKARMESLARDPENEETRRRLASLGYLSGSGKRELLDPKDAIGLEEEVRRAKEAFDDGDSVRAGELLTAILRRNPQNVPALNMAGLIHLRASEYERARTVFEEELRLRPDLDAAHANLAATYKKMGRPDLAIREYKAALAISPRQSEAAANLAQLYLENKQLADARKVIDATLAAGGESADLYFELGVLEASSSNWDPARLAFTRAIAADPRREEAFVNLGKIAFQQGHIDESIHHYQRALRVTPGNADYLATIGSLYLNGKNDPASALRYFEQALAANPRGANADELRELTRALRARGIR